MRTGNYANDDNYSDDVDVYDDDDSCRDERDYCVTLPCFFPVLYTHENCWGREEREREKKGRERNARECIFAI